MDKQIPHIMKRLTISNVTFYVCAAFMAAIAALAFPYLLFGLDVGYTMVFGTSPWPAVLAMAILVLPLSFAYHSAHHYHQVMLDLAERYSEGE